MGTGAIFLFGVTGGGSGGTSATNLIIDADVQDYNVLTTSTALGYDNSSGANITITVTIDSGVNVTASALGGTAFTTGALNANTTVRIINNGNIQGNNGASGAAGSTGGSGGHVIPALNLYDHLKKDFNVKLYTDARGAKYIPKNITWRTYSINIR